jgi:alkylation response protein AidB-like acyl-CoA dehydrogenase
MPPTRSSKHIGVSSTPYETSHFQDAPHFGNQYLEDTFLQATLKRLITNEDNLAKSEKELVHLGDRVVHDMWPHSKRLNIPENQPRLVHYDAWGKRIDEIQTHPSWRYMHGVAANEGIVADGYDVAKWGQDCRLIQFSKLLLFNPSSGLYSCPLAMTDGAVRYLKLALNENVAAVEQKAVQANIGSTFTGNAALAAEARQLLSHLLSRDGEQFYTSGQWMTERGGGSDVAQGTETIARKQPDGTYVLYGYKWFTSATDADMSLTLARIESDDGTVMEGSSGLSCFLVNVRDPQTKQLNNIRVHKLKNKLGTKQLPTAEMELVGTKAKLVSLPGRGVAAITTGMVNVTRLYNSISSCAAIRRVTALARDYSHRREVFGSKLSDNKLHLRTLSTLELNHRACLAVTLDAVSMLGRVETSKSENDLLGGPSIAGSLLTVSEANELVRLLTPILKAWTAKMAMSSVSEGLEMFGGQGYIEDSNIPVALRDAQVLPIWEGTTNVLSMDTLRVLSKSKFEAFFVLERLIKERCSAANTNASLKAASDSVLTALEKVSQFLKSNFGKPSLVEELARDLCLSLARITAGSCLIEHAVWSRDIVDAVAAKRFCCEWTLVSGLDSNTSNVVDLDRALALDLDASGKPRGFGDYDARGMVRAKL